jgi:ubiquitin-protein ligase
MLEIGEKWAPVKNLVKIMDKIKSLLVVPNLESPMNNDAAADYKNGTWAAKAKQTTQTYAK